MMGLLEKLEALIIGGLLACFVYFRHIHWSIDTTAYTNLMSAGVNFSAIAIGFLASVLSIVVAVADKPIVDRMLNYDHRNQRILKYLSSVIRWSFLLLVVSAFGFMIGPLKWFAVWCYVSGGTVAAFERSTRVFISIVRRALYNNRPNIDD